MSTALCLLILEDNPYDAELEIATLEESGYVCRWQRVETQAEFLVRLGTSDYDLILADYSLPAFDGLTALKLVIERDLDLPFILVSGTLGEEVAIESLKAGATDYVLKDRLSRLGPVVRRALREKEEQRQRKRAEEALAEQERYFRTLLHILHEDFLVIDRDYRITDMTGTVLVTTGLTREEVVDRRCFEISHGYDDPCDELGEECLLPEVFETGEPRRCYHEHAHVDGSKSHVDIMLSPLKDEEGHVTHVIEAVRDITDLMLAQESLRESEERLSAFMDSAPDCFMLFDSELNFVDVNDATLEFFPTGTKKEDLIGKNILDVVPGLERTGRYDSYMEVIKTGKPFYVEDFVPHPKFGDRRLTVQAFKVDEGLGLIVTDITERKRTEEALRKSEKRYRSLFEGLPVGLYRMTPQGLILHANPALIQMLGYPDRRALMGVNALDLYVDAEDYERQQALLEREGLARDFEMQFRRYDGTVIWVRNTVQAVRSDRRDVFYHEGSMEDITERKRAEEALQALSSRYEAILAAAPDIIMEVDINKVYTWANNAGFEFFGEDVLGKEAAFYFEGEQDTYDTVQPLFNGAENVIYIESWQRRTDGEKRLLAWWCRGLKDANGDVTGTISTARDITERKRTEEERDRLLEQIRGQVQQVQQIMDTVPEGVLLLDADGQVILANPVAEGDLSVLAGAHVGDTLTRLGDRPLVELLTSPPKGLWHEVTTDSRRFEVIARSLEDGPEPEGWVLVIRDVTREREIQRHAQQRERLATVGQLAAGIAHDFNNIMATIVLYAQMLSQTEDLTPRGHERLATVNQQAMHATNLTQQILDFSRRAVLERRPLNLLPLLKEQIKLLERTLPENIKIALAYGPDEYTVNADPTRVQQAVMNLALNARDAMPEGGNLRFGLERIQVQPGESPPLPEMEVGEWVQVTVADTGSGIPPDILPRVFDPFFTTKAPGEGSGLGLAQVHGIVKQHEGEIDVQSPSTGSGQVPSTEFIPSEAEGLRTGQVGQGTTFTIYLPALPVHPAEAPTLEIEALTKGEGETILVVEDNAPTRQALVESLELLNYRTLEASDGQEALAILERQTSEVSSPEVALVLSDVVMPGMGGVALFHALRQRNLAVKVVLLTGHPLARQANLAFLAG